MSDAPARYFVLTCLISSLFLTAVALDMYTDGASSRWLLANVDASVDEDRTLTLAPLTAPTYRTVVAGTPDVELMRFTLTAHKASTELRQIAFVVSPEAPQSASLLEDARVRIYRADTGVQVAEGIISTHGIGRTNRIEGVTLYAEDPETFVVRGTIARPLPGTVAFRGGTIQISIDASANGFDGTYGIEAVTDALVPIAGVAAYSNTLRVLRAVPQVSTFTTAEGHAGFSIFADGGDVALGKATFVYSSAPGVVVSLPKLRAYIDASLTHEDKDFSGVAFFAATNTIAVYPAAAGENTTYIIPAGYNRYFVLSAEITGAATSVPMELLGDSALPEKIGSALGTFTDVDRGASSSFIWSPVPQHPVLLSEPNFTNGYGIPGL